MSSSSAWYTAKPKPIETLLLSQPSFSALLLFPDFTQEVKSYCPRLVEYLNYHPNLFLECINLLTQPPTDFDTDDRKYKLPLKAIESIQLGVNCILDGFFKRNIGQPQLTCPYDYLWKSLQTRYQTLPVLSGYFLRAQQAFLLYRPQQTIQAFFTRPQNLQSLLSRAADPPFIQTLQLFLCSQAKIIDSYGNERLAIKLEAIREIINCVTHDLKSWVSQVNVHSLDSWMRCSPAEGFLALFENIADRYFMIDEGSSMLGLLLEESCILPIVAMVHSESLVSQPSFNFLICAINHYSSSAGSWIDPPSHPDCPTDTMLELDEKPLVKALVAVMKNGIIQAQSAPRINHHLFKLLKFFCHSISLPSTRMFRLIRQTRLYECLSMLLLKHPRNNMLHELIWKTFMHVFLSEWQFYEPYRYVAAFESKLIDMVHARIKQPGFAFEQFRKQGYFGHLIKILRLIAKGPQKLTEALRTSPAWIQISHSILEPYERMDCQKLGTRDHIPEPVRIQYTVKRQAEARSAVNEAAIAELRLQDESIPNCSYTLNLLSLPVPIADKLAESQSTSFACKTSPPLTDAQSFGQSFEDFMAKKKAETTQQFTLKRSVSRDRQLSKGKSKMSSPSPKRKNEWGTSDRIKDEREDTPKLPPPRLKDQSKSTPLEDVSKSKSQNNLNPHYVTSTHPHPAAHPNMSMRPNGPAPYTLGDTFQFKRGNERYKISVVEKPQNFKTRTINQNDRKFLQALLALGVETKI